MSDVAILVENLGKMYRIGGPQEGYRTFRDAMTRSVAAPFRRARDLLRGQAYGAAGLKEEIWALKEVAFEVRHGEVIGIIGRNGAGKSTLLKILSRITEPTTGYADVYGRVGALLEVGTGFHPELTGRENVYLNGAILGMSRREIERRFDEIVDFAGVEKFIDTPVKHYSSGMGLRLGFAVAAHLEPEILVVDEVLAVGDAEFQKKCLGKMSNVANEGRTVLFVSHNMSAIQNLCTRAIHLQSGQIVESGDTALVIDRYLKNLQTEQSSADLSGRVDRSGSGWLRLVEISLLDHAKHPVSAVESGGSAIFQLKYESHYDLSADSVWFAIRFHDPLGGVLFTASTHLTQQHFDNLPKSGCVYCLIPQMPLTSGRYSITVSCTFRGSIADRILDAMYLNVTGGDFFTTGKMPEPISHGHFLVKQDWFR